MSIEKRIAALEERRRGDRKRIAVIQQNEDGSWPTDPSDAALVVAIRRLGLPDPSQAPMELL